MRVLHAPVNVGNQPWVLSRHERSLGVESDLIVNYSTWLEYPADVILGNYGDASPGAYVKRLFHGLRAPFHYDVLHCYFGRSLMFWDDYGSKNRFPFLDLKIARRLGRKIFFTLQGCDVRIAGESNSNNEVTMCRPDGCSAYEACISNVDKSRRRLISETLPLADRVLFLNPELGHYVPGGVFLPYSNVDVKNVAAAAVSARKKPKILHAPSDPGIKGSALIEAALEEIQNEFDFDYVPVRGLPHAEAMKLYVEADLVIDQVLAGWYGGFAVEVMAMAKPVVCYIRESDLHFLPPKMRSELPILRVDPRTLTDDLRRIFARRSEWPDIGETSRAYVRKWHNPEEIARAMIAAYNHPDSLFDLSAVTG